MGSNPVGDATAAARPAGPHAAYRGNGWSFVSGRNHGTASPTT